MSYVANKVMVVGEADGDLAVSFFLHSGLRRVPQDILISCCLQNSLISFCESSGFPWIEDLASGRACVLPYRINLSKEE